MVIGNGMIAEAFKSYKTKNDFIIFASGVSDSIHPDPNAFEREKNLLIDTIQKNGGKQLAYFSTCSIYDDSMKDAPYVKHKEDMEALIMEQQSNYTIFRLSNPVGRTQNTTTIINFLAKSIQQDQSFEVWKNASRNIIDLDDMYTICHEILEKKLFPNTIVNIANPHNYTMPYIVETIEKHFHKKANYGFVNKGGGPKIDTSQVEPLFKEFNINFDKNYLTQLLQKYFPD